MENHRIEGKIFGVRLERRQPEDPHVCVRLQLEDDGCWGEIQNSFSAYWIDDLIDVLQRTKKKIEDLPDYVGPDLRSYGKKFS